MTDELVDDNGVSLGITLKQAGDLKMAILKFKMAAQGGSVHADAMQANLEEFVIKLLVAKSSEIAALKAQIQNDATVKEAAHQLIEAKDTEIAALKAQVELLQSALQSVQTLHGNLLVGIRACNEHAPLDPHAWSGLANLTSQALIGILYKTGEGE
jgi:hypothetical protein